MVLVVTAKMKDTSTDPLRLPESRLPKSLKDEIKRPGPEDRTGSNPLVPTAADGRSRVDFSELIGSWGTMAANCPKRATNRRNSIACVIQGSHLVWSLGQQP